MDYHIKTLHMTVVLGQLAQADGVDHIIILQRHGQLIQALYLLMEATDQGLTMEMLLVEEQVQ